MLLSELRTHSQKAGQPPGTLVYTGKKKIEVPHITVAIYDDKNYYEKEGTRLEDCLPQETIPGITWIHLEGLQDVELIQQIAQLHNLHLLSIEDILNIEQRPKIEEFSDYFFITIKEIFWSENINSFNIEQFSIIFGKDFVLSFEERQSAIFRSIRERLRSTTGQRLRTHGSDYLVYRLIDTVVDQYFVALETIGDKIDHIEGLIIANPTPQNARMLYNLKRQLLIIRKAIWPVREAISHLLQTDVELVTSFTHLYLRDAYDHSIQAIDTLEIFRDMLASMLDVYLSSLTNRMNEVMKVLTIIATIFIPVTFIASIYGMNFKYMPELEWRWGYPSVLGVMLLVIIIMLYYFRRKHWW
jgi:magnesium transporter